MKTLKIRFKRNAWILLPALLLTVVVASGCAKTTQPVAEVEVADKKIDIMVSISPLVEFVEKVGGDKVQVEEVIPPGYEPHSYELTPQQLKKISDIDLYVKAGYIEFEDAYMDKIIAQNSSMKVINGAEGVQVREIEAHSHEHDEDGDDHEEEADEHEDEDEHDEDGHDHEEEADEHEDDHEDHEIDPHTWLSTTNAKIYIRNIYNVLVELDPDNKEYYTANKQAYEQELDKANELAKKILGEIENKKVIVYHPAFGYFLDEYGFEQISIEIEGKEPTAAQLEELIEEAKEESVTIIFVQKQFSTYNAEIVADEIDGTVVQVDPLAKDYVQNMNSISDAIVNNQ